LGQKQTFYNFLTSFSGVFELIKPFVRKFQYPFLLFVPYTDR
jgi:hypothetical protein